MGQKILVDQNCARAPFPDECAFWIDRINIPLSGYKLITGVQYQPVV
nr:hypothetical protein [Sinorhizobium medicae]